MNHNLSYISLLNNISDLISDTCKLIIKQNNLDYNHKIDGSPVTKADIEADKLIFSRLRKLTPHIPIISEERSLDKDNLKNDLHWIIDPLDGTQSYIKGKDEYTVNIALIENKLPILGAVGHPPSGIIWFGANKNAYKKNKKGITKKIQTRNIPIKQPIIITSHAYTNIDKPWFKNLIKPKIIKISSSIKFCKIAEGDADIYPRFNNIREWDIAAGHAILLAAGGIVLNTKGDIVRYTNENRVADPFVAFGDSYWVKNNILEKQ